VKCAAVFLFLASLLFCTSLRAQNSTASGRSEIGRTLAGRTVVVIPFENASPTPGLEWLGESFPETFH
jgi:TolB-like protein